VSYSDPTPRRPAPPGVPNGTRKQAGQSNAGRNKKLANGLVALSTAAVMAVYGVGYARTAPAANIANSDQAPLVASLAATETPTAALATATITPTATTTSVAGATTSAIPTSTATVAAPTSTRIPTATPTAASTASSLRDGTYTGTGTSRHGSIGVTVVVLSGKIVSADITTCGTRYPCSKIANLPGEVIVRQSANVDFVSGSTDSSTAYKAAVTAALAKAA
jgi:uncharacterized protein with FMN-binding domain